VNKKGKYDNGNIATFVLTLNFFYGTLIDVESSPISSYL
jgi:hypothetical protein